MQLKTAIDVKQSSGYVAAGVTTVTGSAIKNDDGVDSVLHVAHLGAVTAGTATVAKVQHGDLADASDMADVSGATYTVLDADSSKFIAIELAHPSKKYSRMVLTRATQNVVLNSMFAVLNQIRKQPVVSTTVVGPSLPINA